MSLEDEMGLRDNSPSIPAEIAPCSFSETAKILEAKWKE